MMNIGYFSKYRGYVGTIEFDIEDGCYYGKIQNTRDLVNYESNRTEGLLVEFRRAVDDYLDFMKEIGKEVENDDCYAC